MKMIKEGFELNVSVNRSDDYDNDPTNAVITQVRPMKYLATIRKINGAYIADGVGETIDEAIANIAFRPGVDPETWK